MSLVHPPVKYAWKTKQVQSTKNPPVKDTAYEVFDETGGVRLVSLVIYETNTETDDKDIDIIITLDGTARTYDASVIGSISHGKLIGVYLMSRTATDSAYTVDVLDLTSSGASFALSAGLADDSHGKPLEGHTLKVEVKMTSTPGTAQTLSYFCVYETLEAV